MNAVNSSSRQGAKINLFIPLVHQSLSRLFLTSVFLISNVCDHFRTSFPLKEVKHSLVHENTGWQRGRLCFPQQSCYSKLLSLILVCNLDSASGSRFHFLLGKTHAQCTLDIGIEWDINLTLKGVRLNETVFEVQFQEWEAEDVQG